MRSKAAVTGDARCERNLQTRRAAAHATRKRDRRPPAEPPAILRAPTGTSRTLCNRRNSVAHLLDTAGVEESPAAETARHAARELPLQRATHIVPALCRSGLLATRGSKPCLSRVGT